MLVDYKKRCVIEGDGHDVIRYGVSAKEANAIDGGHYWRNVETRYVDLSVGGRKSGNPIENEYRLRKHFYNKRIQTDEEKARGQRQQLRSDSDRDDVGAHDTGGSVQGAGQVAFPSTVAGSGGGDAHDAGEATYIEESKPETEEDGNQKEVT